jgi:hypothetical protein
LGQAALRDRAEGIAISGGEHLSSIEVERERPVAGLPL